MSIERKRKAGVMWKGDLKNGEGVISTESQALFEEPYSFPTRFEEEPGTNPEELIAAAHAACFSMAFAGALKKKGFQPEQVDTNATCTLQSKEDGYGISKMHLHVRGKVPGINKETFIQISKEADKGCPVSNLLREGLKIEIEAELY